MWGAVVKIVSQIVIVRNVKRNLTALLYSQERINKNNIICHANCSKVTKVVFNIRAKNVYLQMLNNYRYLASDITHEFRLNCRQYHTIMQSGEMEAGGIFNASNDLTTTASDDKAMKEKGEKRKSEEELHKHRGKKRRGGGGKKLRPGERYVPPPQKRNPGVSFSQEHFQETSYYFEGGLRKVYPYYFDYKTYCKGRWIGKSLREVFNSEFRAEPLDYYEQAVQLGRIRLNETPVEDLDITLKNNDFMRNTVHRHEPPVSARPLEILEDNGEVVVVDKPASLPVHPCGRFRHNTVIFILGKERGLCSLHTVHRLDRLTSGVLLFARTLEVSKRLDQLVRDRQLEKEYLCRVEGQFPEEELVCEEPILVVSFKVGVCRVDPKGKPCRTVFQRLSWNGCSSVVRCLPHTGRTHQIRVHLQFLGHPILNDPIYGSSAWGPTRAKGGVVGLNDEQLLQALIEEHNSKESLHLLDLPDDGLAQGRSHSAGEGLAISASNQSGSADCADIGSVNTLGVPGVESHASHTCMDPKPNPEDLEKNAGNSRKEVVSATTNLPACDLGGRDAVFMQTGTDNSEKEVVYIKADSIQTQNQSQSQELSSCAGIATQVRDHLCTECKLVRPDPTEKELVMYLHALRYKGPDFEYSTRIPEWAREDWEED
ncbi:RNA pseudouridylate synthase domain-containing protein 2 [Anguilla anguilla]|nr:RNA pseudouridylate synthase domain-containing protein 2 [Anguilla anguilla]